MREADTFTESLFTMRHMNDFVPAKHTLRPIRVMINIALVKMDALLSGMYEADIKGDRPSIARIINENQKEQIPATAH